MKLKTALVLIALSLPLAGCGNKGPLVLPQAPLPADEVMPVEPPVEEVPADPVPVNPDAQDPAAAPVSPAGETPDSPAPRDGDG